MSDGWYVSHGGKVLGPYTWERVLDYAHAGMIADEDVVMRPGSDEWVPATDVLAFATASILLSTTRADVPATGPGESPSAPAPVAQVGTCPQCGGTVEPGAVSCLACGLEMSATLSLPTSEPTLLAVAAPAPPPTVVDAAPVGAGATAALAPRGRRVAQVALVATAVVTLLLVACVFGWNALGSRGGRIFTPPESTATPPPSQPVTKSTGPITEPKVGSAERTALMDAARARLGIQDKFVVKGIFVQGDRAVGVLSPDGSTVYHLVAWGRSGGKWTATWNGSADAASKTALEKAEPGLSLELVGELRF